MFGSWVILTTLNFVVTQGNYRHQGRGLPECWEEHRHHPAGGDGQEVEGAQALQLQEVGGMGCHTVYCSTASISYCLSVSQSDCFQSILSRYLTLIFSLSHCLAVSQPHYLTISLSCYLSVSLYHSLTTSLYCYFSVSLSHSLTTSLSHYLAISLSHCLTTSLSCYFSVSLSPCLTTSLSHYLAISLSHYLSISLSCYFSVSLSHYLAIYLSHCLTITLSCYFSVSLFHCLPLCLTHPTSHFRTDPSNKTLSHSEDFQVKHYAGDVVYTITGFIEKNRTPCARTSRGSCLTPRTKH